MQPGAINCRRLWFRLGSGISKIKIPLYNLQRSPPEIYRGALCTAQRDFQSTIQVDRLFGRTVDTDPFGDQFHGFKKLLHSYAPAAFFSVCFSFYHKFLNLKGDFYYKFVEKSWSYGGQKHKKNPENP